MTVDERRLAEIRAAVLARPAEEAPNKRFLLRMYDESERARADTERERDEAFAARRVANEQRALAVQMLETERAKNEELKARVEGLEAQVRSDS